MLGALAPFAVETVRQLAESIAPRADDPGCLRRLAGCEDELSGREEFAAGEERFAGGDPLCEDAVVSAPRDVDAVHSPRLEPEPGSARRQQQGRVGTGSPSAALAQVGAERERPALRAALAEVAARRVEQLGRVPRHREGEEHRLHGVGRVGGVPKSHPLMDQTRGSDAQFQLRGEAGFRVREREQCAMVIGLQSRDLEARAESCTIRDGPRCPAC